MSISQTNPTKKISEFSLSLLAWPRGFLYTLQNPWIYKYIFTAIVLNLLVFVVLVFLAWGLSEALSTWILSYFADLSLPFYFFLNTIFWVLFVFLIMQVFSGISSVVNAPVYSILTSKIIQKRFPDLQMPHSNLLQDLLMALNFEIKKLLLGLGIFIVLLFLNLLPVLGSILYLILTLIQIIFLTGLDVFEPYHSLKRYSFRKRLSAISARPFFYWPFLLICGVLGSLPLLNIFFIPISIVGVCELVKEQD